MSNTIGLGEYTEEDILTYLKELGVTVYTQEEVNKLIAEAESAQNEFSRSDEFLWFARKLDEYMGNSTSQRYKAFQSNYVKPNSEKCNKYFKEQYEQNN